MTGFARLTDLLDVAAVLARTPLIADLRPGGRFTARDVREIGGTAVIIPALIEMGAMVGSCLTATGATLAQTYGGAAPPAGVVVRAAGAPIAPDGGSRC
jgi:dihydroxy-acid dehydratase